MNLARKLRCNPRITQWMQGPSNRCLSSFARKGAQYSSTNPSLALAFILLMSINFSYADEKPITEKKLPTYRLSEVAKHTTRETGIWVTYKGDVYDISKFIPNHPGGRDKIMMAAGKDIEPFWNLYRQHYNSKLPQELLANMLIGHLHPEDAEALQKANQSDKLKDDNPYKNDPVIAPVMRIYNRTPINAEAPRVLETDNWVTPVDLWFVRNHHPVPQLQDPNTYKLAISFLKPRQSSATSTPSTSSSTSSDGKNDTKVLHEYTLPQLQAFQEYSVVSSVQCGGNRRSEMNVVEVTNGIAWEISAISTAKWTGVKLRDILSAQGITEESIDEGMKHEWIKHVHFISLDGMEASVPIRKALDRYGDVLLAYHMNDTMLAQKHGYPLRIIVPGHAGVRNVKWLREIRLSAEEAFGPWQRGMAYKGFGPSVKSLEDIDVEKIPSLQEQPVQSAISYPLPNTPIPANDIVTVKGYAYSGGGRGIVRVDVSIDGGDTWHTARLLDGSEQPFDRAWAWTFWDCDFPITNDFVGKKLEVICKATDASYNVQPDTVKGIWNLRGINNNAWHRITVNVIPEVVEEDTEESDE